MLLAAHHSTVDGTIDTNALDWDVDVDNMKATGIVSIEIIGTGQQAGETWTVGSTTTSGAQVSLVINSGVHAMVLLKGSFYSTNQPGDTYPYVLMDRCFGQQKYRLIKDIHVYGNSSALNIIDCGTTMATAEQLVQVAREDLKLKWANDYTRPMENGEESFCLYYALCVMRALNVIKNVVPVKASIWTEDQMADIIKFVDPSWTCPQS